MTLDHFIKQLEALRQKHGGRCKVTVDKTTFSDGNGTWQVCDVHKVEFSLVPQVDGDGAIDFNKDGSERTAACIVITG